MEKIKVINKELEPCPFCGGKAWCYNDGAYWHPECVVCYATLGEWFDSCEEAITAWNTRVELKAKPKNINAPFSIGDIVEPIVKNPYSSEYEVVDETSTMMDLKCVEGKLEGLTIKRSKKTLARDWKIAER